MRISDKEIEEKVKEQLRWDDRINDINIFVSARDGNIKVYGSISSYYAKKLVTENAKKINGVSSIENDLKVRYLPVPEKGLPSDKELENNIKVALELNVSINASKISVEVNKGIANLEGTVDAYWKKDIVESIVSGFNGIIDIVNKIAIIHMGHEDEKIAEDIIGTLDRYRNVNVNDIKIAVEDGKVSISGKVSDWEAYDAAMDAIHHTHGVNDIKDNLIIASM
ncbi:MAG: BON domain-containing protein [Promethearchaeota archaeon]